MCPGEGQGVGHGGRVLERISRLCEKLDTGDGFEPVTSGYEISP